MTSCLVSLISVEIFNRLLSTYTHIYSSSYTFKVWTIFNFEACSITTINTLSVFFYTNRLLHKKSKGKPLVNLVCKNQELREFPMNYMHSRRITWITEEWFELPMNYYSNSLNWMNYHENVEVRCTNFTSGSPRVKNVWRSTQGF